MSDYPRVRLLLNGADWAANVLHAIHCRVVEVNQKCNQGDYVWTCVSSLDSPGGVRHEELAGDVGRIESSRAVESLHDLERVRYAADHPFKRLWSAFAGAPAAIAVVDLDVSALPESLVGFTADVAVDGSVRAAIDAAAERFGGLVILVNDAGTGAAETVEDNDDAQCDGGRPRP